MTPTSAQSTRVSVTVTVFVEGDEVVEQAQSYDPDTKELTVSVPAHSDREAITLIYGETSMVTSYNTYCIIGDSPEDLDTSSYENPKPDSSTPLNSSDVQSVFIFNVLDEDDMSEDEKETLPESFKTLCESKTIRRASQVIVNETVFEQSNFFDSTLFQSSGSSRAKRQAWRDKVNRFLTL